MNKRKLLTLAMTLCMVAILAVGGTLAYFTDTDDVKNTFTMGKVDITLDEAKVDKDGQAPKEDDRVQENDYTTTNMVPGYEFDKDPTIHVLKGSEESYIFLDMTINKYSSLFWVMAADAAADNKITLYNDDGTLADAFKNDKGVFSTTKFLDHMKTDKDTMQYIVDKWFNGINHADWTVKAIFVGKDKDDVTKDGKYLTLRLAYKVPVNAKEIDEESIDIQFMESFQMPASVTQKMILDGQKPNVGGMENAFNATKEAPFHMNFKAYAIQAAEMDDVNAAYNALFGMEAQYK